MAAVPASETAQLLFERSSVEYCPEDFDMRFRLTYEGELKGTGNRSDPAHVHRIRRVFHAQLRQFWEVHPYLKVANAVKETRVHPRRFTEIDPSLRNYLANQHQHNGYNFVPLITEELSLSCGLDILFMRPSMPGAILNAGDVDGRIKTIFDALKMPIRKENLGGYDLPLPGEHPFYVLLEEDELVSHVSVTTDVLLQPTKMRAGRNDARLVIAVSIKPINSGWHNINFGGA